MNFEVTNRHGEKIVGLVEEPGRDRLAIVMHGLSGTTEQEHIKVLRQAFLEGGFSVVAFDCTHSFGKSEGAYEVVTLTSYLEDLEDVIEWSKTQAWFRKPFSLTGHSMGAYAVARYAELHPNNSELLIAFAPVISGEKLQASRLKTDPESYKQWEKTGWFEEESSTRPGLIKRLKWYPHVADSYKHNLLPEAGKITSPTLIIVGENDHACPASDQQELLQAVGSPDKELVIVPGAPHTIKSAENLAMLHQTILDWLKKHRKASE